VFLATIADLLDDVRLYVTIEQMRSNIEVTLANLRSARPDLLIFDIVPQPQDAERLLERLEADPELSALSGWPPPPTTSSPSGRPRIPTSYTSCCQSRSTTTS
jgi:hypothetical protein